MDYKEYTGTPLTLKVSLRNSGDKSAYIYVDSISNRATHILLYQQENGTRPAVPKEEIEKETLINRENRKINVTGFVTGYYLLPAVYDEKNRVYLIDNSAESFVEAGQKIELICKEERIKETKECDRVNISISAVDGEPIPFDGIYYRIGATGTYKYPIVKDLINGGRFTVFVPKGTGVSIRSYDEENIIIKNIGK